MVRLDRGFTSIYDYRVFFPQCECARRMRTTWQFLELCMWIANDVVAPRLDQYLRPVAGLCPSSFNSFARMN
nr:unnamed protein product [Haemonchus contortus]